jgi:large subunit ribosomal protein L15
MRLPKLRGFKNPFREEYQVVNVERLGQLFPSGGTVGVEDLVAAGADTPWRTGQDLGTGSISAAHACHRGRLSGAAKERSPLLVAARPRTSISGLFTMQSVLR